MSQTSGAGGSAAPGWYTDPHDPSQLRWWSGEGWTEHVSGGSAPAQQGVQAAPADPVAAQPVAAQPVAAQPGDPLPSRRALRDPATEASEVAEAALQAQQQGLQAPQVQQQQQPVAQAMPAQQQPQADFQQVSTPPAQPNYPPQAVAQTSAPVPTLPVQPRSFLEQAGYPPLDATPSAPTAWSQPSVPVQASTPQAPSAPTTAWPAQPTVQQPAAQQPTAQQPGAQQPPVQQPSAPQVVAPAQSAQPNAWNQQPATQLPPVQPAWGAPGSAAPTQTQDGLDSLFGGAPAVFDGAPAAAAPAPAYAAPDQTAWGLSPTGQAAGDVASGSRRRSSESSAPESAGSSTFWAWLIAISPILAAGAIGYVIVSTGYVLSGWPIEAAIAAPYVLVLLFALADRSGLQTLGHSEPRSPAWALLSAPVYLIVRAGETRREDGSGTVLTLVWLASFVVAVAGFVGWGILTHHALVTGLPTRL